MLEFRDICLRATSTSKTSTSDDSTLKTLGTLMDESHKSCSELCENSCAELDLLVRLAKEAGAYGSRVTGPSSPLFSVKPTDFKTSVMQVRAGAGALSRS